MKANELRNLYVNYYKERRHEFAAAASLVPEDDTVLFTSAGMQPLIPYFKGMPHPKGNRLVNVQRCLRTGDIDEVGVDFHLTVFEMLGNWSLGDYFKQEAIKMSFKFLTEIIKMPVEKLAVTVHKGNAYVPLDEETRDTWLSLGLTEDQIFYYGDEENWWGPVGTTGPCGPDSEMFYVNDIKSCGESCGPACDCGKYMELGNNVFMTYNKDEKGQLTELEQKNIDVGLGLERLLILSNGVKDVYKTDLFLPLIKALEKLSHKEYNLTNERAFRIICEHVRASVFILADPNDIVPSNSEQGYILRRLIRRTIRMMHQLAIEGNIMLDLADIVVEHYHGSYPEIKRERNKVIKELEKEYAKFNKTLEVGLKEANRYIRKLEDKTLSGEKAFKLYDTYGFPLEFTIEIAKEHHVDVDIEDFQKKFLEHQEKSRAGSKNKFGGGLAEHDEKSIKLHTATHLLHAALRKVLGETVYQKGSHINSERLRFDFSFDRKLTQDEIKAVEAYVNEAIDKHIDIECREMSLEAAKKSGAIGLFEFKYDAHVQVYSIEGYSLEICGGPHVENTSLLGRFKILKEQSSSSGVRRIKATVK